MQVFYTSIIKESEAFFDAEESAHIVQSLRKRSGEAISFTDGLGNLYKGHLLSTDKRAVVASIISTNFYPKSLFTCSLFIAPTKQMDRLEWAVEKAVEMGVGHIGICFTERTERNKIRMERLVRIASAAMKQSLQFHIPNFALYHNLLSALENARGQKLLATCSDEAQRHIAVAMEELSDVSVFIGPEGDFTEKEVQLALNAGCSIISLGEQRLRTETAAVYAASVFKSINKL